MIGLYRAANRHMVQLGREGVIGIGLLALCLNFYLFALKPVHLQIIQLHDSVASLKQGIEGNAHWPLIEKESPAEQLSVYYSFFPAQTTTPEWLEKIFTAAKSEKIRLKEGEYRVNREKAGKLIRYQITLPVSGSYLQLRKFLATVLSEIPIASLDHISFKRQKIGDSVISAEIKLTLYLDQQR
jgi:Pilus assembly protein, PilO